MAWAVDPTTRFAERCKNMLLYNCPGKFDPASGKDVALAELIASNMTLAFTDLLKARLGADQKQTAATQISAVDAEGCVWVDPEKYAAALTAVEVGAVENPAVPAEELPLEGAKG